MTRDGAGTRDSRAALHRRAVAAAHPSAGSIIWRPNMPHMMSVPGYVPGWRRRFWQASPDHRGYPEAPGRVVTLLRHAESTTWGMVFQVDAQHMENVLAELDHREKVSLLPPASPVVRRPTPLPRCSAGRLRAYFCRHFLRGRQAPLRPRVRGVRSERPLRGTGAARRNRCSGAHWARPQPHKGRATRCALTDRGSQIDRSQGPSGPNDEYLLELAMALPSLGVIDPHIAALERCLTARRRSRGTCCGSPRWP